MKTYVSALLITAVVAFFSGAAESVVYRDIVLAMPFDEGKGETTKDLSSYGNHGILKQNAKWEAGKFGNAIQVEADGYVEVGNDRSLKLYKSDFTIAVWINMNETLFGHRHAFIAQDEAPGFFDKWILGYSLNGNPSFNLHTIITFDDGGISRGGGFGGGREVQPKTWHQVAMVRHQLKDGFWEEFTFYLDGKQVGRPRKVGSRMADEFISQFNDAPVTIGFAEKDVWLDGLVDEVLIAKWTFTEDEISAHFQGGIKRGLGLAVEPDEKSAVAWGAIKGNIMP